MAYHQHHSPPSMPDQPAALPAGYELEQIDALYQEIPKQQVDFQLENLNKSIARQTRFFSHVNIANLNFQDPLEARVAGEFFASLFPDPLRAKLGVMELLMNAIEHGNLGITSEEKHDLLTRGCWMKEIARRLKDEQYSHKRVHAYCYRSSRYIKLTIRDEGAGFDPTGYLNKQHTTPHSQLNGRGLAMAKHIAFDEMGYNRKANAVWALQYL